MQDYFLSDDSFFINRTVSDLVSPNCNLMVNFSMNEYLEKIQIREGSIKCVVISTYRLNLEFIRNEFPSIFSENSTIPCTFLHGDSIYIEEKLVQNRLGKVAYKNPKINIKDEPVDSYEQEDSTFYLNLPESVILAEVSPQKNRHKNSHIDRKAIAGVHHPKYMMVFVDKGLYIAISTGNFTPEYSIDATWTQFFPIAKSEGKFTNDFGVTLQDFLLHQSDQIVERNNPKNDKSSCFDFISWLTHHSGITKELQYSFDYSNANVDLVSVVPGIDPVYSSVEEKCKNNNRNIFSNPCKACLGKINSFRTSVDSYWSRPSAFSEGTQYTDSDRFDTDIKSFVENSRIEKYDSQYVNNNDDCTVLNKVTYGAEKLNSCLRYRYDSFNFTLSNLDTLIIQPTSISTGVNIQYIAYLISRFKFSESYNSEWLESWRLIWPTDDFIKSNSDKSCPYSSSAGLFLQPDVLFDMKEDLHDKFYTYSPSKCSIFNGKLHRPPHMKSFCRVMHSKHPMHKDFKSQDKRRACTCINIAWFLLTSACLSKGAQGEYTPAYICNECNNSVPSSYDYKNFELGVLFHSTCNLQYRALHSSCPIHSNSDGKDFKFTLNGINFVILPLPYDIIEGGSVKYCSDNLMFKFKPFMHDILQPHIFSKIFESDVCLSQQLESNHSLKRSHNQNDYKENILLASKSQKLHSIENYSTVNKFDNLIDPNSLNKMKFNKSIIDYQSKTISENTIDSNITLNDCIDPDNSSLIYDDSKLVSSLDYLC